MALLEGILRRFQPIRVAKGPIDGRVTFTESWAVEQVSAPGHEMTRAGRHFHIAYNGSVPTGIAPVQAFPTTAAQWVIWNADASKTYCFYALGALVFSGTTGLGGELLATVVNAPVQIGASVAGLVVVNASGSAIGSKAIVKSGVTLTDPAVPLWAPVAEQVGAAAIVGPASCIYNRGGRVLKEVPPGKGLAFAVLAPAGTTPLYLPLAEWDEVETDME